jgi:hypothetical protein
MTKARRLTPPQGMYLEAFNWNGKSLTKMGNPTTASWDGQKPIVAHSEFKKDVWYSNDNDFKREIKGFSKNDRYAMRWSGGFATPQAGVWEFKTRSDDGSQLWIDGKRVVNNDGNHGMQTRTGKAQLKKGWNKLIVTFYENGGGAGLQCAGVPAACIIDRHRKDGTLRAARVQRFHNERDGDPKSGLFNEESLDCVPRLDQRQRDVGGW